VQENIDGVRVVRAFGRERAESRMFSAMNREYVGRNRTVIKLTAMFYPGLHAMIGLLFGLIFYLGSRAMIRGTLSIGSFIAFQLYLGRMVWPFIALGWVTNIFQRGAASMGRLNYILTAEAGINDASATSADASASRLQPRDGDPPESAASESTIRGEIEFRHLTFTYPTASNGSAGAAVLHDINLHIPAGSTLAIVGPTGSGKSTLAALIARLWEAPSGTLLLDGRSIRDYPLTELRRAIGYVPQDTFLFSDTLRENISFGVTDALEEHVFEAAEIASISGEIQSFPQRYDTMVGERGITLSGGQKQRTALARAIVRQPKILILDDALSSVDTDTEERILRRLREVMRERTTVLISHRVSTVKSAGLIIVLREGCIIERGTHEELLALGGYYADLHLKQLLEEELARE